MQADAVTTLWLEPRWLFSLSDITLTSVWLTLRAKRSFCIAAKPIQ